jgi:hypothetical protein
LDIKITKRPFENVTVQIFGDDINKSTFNSEEIKRRINSGNACYHLFHILLSSHLLQKKVKIGIYKIIILALDLYGCETSTEGVREQGAKEDIWTKEGGGHGRVKKTTY